MNVGRTWAMAAVANMAVVKYQLQRLSRGKRPALNVSPVEAGRLACGKPHK